MEIAPLCGELDVLENRRARLEEMLEPGMVSDELRKSLLLSLRDVEQRIALCRWSQRPQPRVESRAA